jgi:hypothetical protein
MAVDVAAQDRFEKRLCGKSCPSPRFHPGSGGQADRKLAEHGVIETLLLDLDFLQFLAGLVCLALAVPQGGIKAAFRQQLVMSAALGDLALVEDDDLVGIDDR